MCAQTLRQCKAPAWLWLIMPIQDHHLHTQARHHFLSESRRKTSFSLCLLGQSHRARQLNAILPVVAMALYILVAHTQAHACRQEHSTGEDTRSQPQWQPHKLTLLQGMAL